MVVRVGDRALARKAGRLVADQAHPVRYKFQHVGMPRPSDNRFGGSEDLTSRNAGADRLSGRQLNLVDLAEQILQLRVGLPMDSHSGEVADIAFIVGARIQGKHIALSPEQLLRWGADVARAGGGEGTSEIPSLRPPPA